MENIEIYSNNKYDKTPRKIFKIYKVIITSILF